MSETHAVTGAQMRAAYDALGLDPELFKSTASITLTPIDVVVSRYRLKDGHPYVEEGTKAIPMNTVALQVKWSASAPPATAKADAGADHPAADG